METEIDMIKFEAALKKVLAKADILGIQELPVDKTIGYVLAENIRAGYDMPLFNKSAMDGYAVHSNDLKIVPVRLKCVATIRAGESYSFRRNKRTVKKGECVKIMTGSPLPRGTDSVVMVEYTEEDNNGWIRILKGVNPGENVCFKGEDVKNGSVVLGKGMLIRGPEVAIISSLGITKVKVFRKPTVTILNTGDEIVEPGNKLTYGKIYNSNGHMLLSLFRDMGIKARYLGIAKDEEKILTKKIMEGFNYDIFLISGGVSMGDYDLIPAVLGKCGVKKMFHKIKIKPGKPVFFGIKENRLIFGIPGNPVSTYLVFLILIKPVIDKMMGKKPDLNIRRGILKEDFKQIPGRKHFVPAKVIDKLDNPADKLDNPADKLDNPADKRGLLKVYPVRGYHGSADIFSLSQANAFMIIDENVSLLRRNRWVNLIRW